jgi:hypothetical protein
VDDKIEVLLGVVFGDLLEREFLVGRHCGEDDRVCRSMYLELGER